MAAEKEAKAAKPAEETSPEEGTSPGGQAPSSGSSKFSTVEIVIMMIIAIFNDLITLATYFSLAIPILGEVFIVITEIVDFVVWAIMLIWFAFKVGLFGIAGFVQMISGIMEFVGLPSRTISTIIGIVAVNNPTLGKIAAEVTNPEGAMASEVIGGETKPKA